MKAIVSVDQSVKLVDYDSDVTESNLSDYDVRIRIQAAGMNRRDLYINDRRDNHDDPVILGSDGAGIVVDVGEKVTRFNIGDAVVVNPGLNWDKNTNTSPDDLEIVGFPNHGTFAEYKVHPEAYLELKPVSLSTEEAAVLCLAGLTGYRALVTKGAIKEGETVFIPGAGSGVSTFMIQFAKAKGARVIVSSRFKHKLLQAGVLGANLLLLDDWDWQQALKDEKIDLVIDSIGEATFNRSLDVLRPGGRLVTFGATTDDIVSFDVRTFFYKQQSILGSTLGSREELREMLAFVEEHKIKPVIDQVYSFSEYEAAFEKLKDSEHFGKIVLTPNESEAGRIKRDDDSMS